jgi:predicted MFS family arabinose efflux permease
MRFRFEGLWRDADFMRLWTGETISVFGSLIGGIALQFTAIIWLHATPLEVSILTTSQLVPGFALALFAGAWVDRLPRRPVLIAADIGRAAVLATVPVAAALGVLGLGQLYAVAATASGLTVIFSVAYRAYLPSLVRQDQLVEGNSKLTASASVAEFGSFSASGWLVQLLSGPGAIVIDAASFLASAAFLMRIRRAEPPRNGDGREPILLEVRDGLRVVAHDPVLRSLAVTEAILRLATSIVGTLILLYLYNEVGFRPGTLGLIFAVGGLSSLAGAAVAGRSQAVGGLGAALVISVVVRAAGMAFVPLASSVSAFAVVCLVANQLVTDPAWTFYEINELSLRQAITPAELQGRMHATISVIGFAAMLAGTLAAGVLGEALGVRTMLFAASGATLCAAVWLARSPVASLRNTPARAEAAVEAALP